MTAPLPYTLDDIITKVRRITARQSADDISDMEIVRYLNTFYVYDFPEHLRLESLKTTYQFLTRVGIPVYDFPTELYLTNQAPVLIGGYSVNYVQNRSNFISLIQSVQYIQSAVWTGNGTVGPYTAQTLTYTQLVPGWKPNPPGAYSSAACQAKYITWQVVVSGTDSSGNSVSLVDDGQGNLIDPNDPATPPSYPVVRGSVNYSTGVISINSVGFPVAIGSGNPINVTYLPCTYSRPFSVLFFADQFSFFPIPDQAYTVSVEAYEYPFAFNTDPTQGQVVQEPKLREWWQLLAYGAADKIFADQGDIESMQRFRPLLDEQMKLVNRRTVVQQTQSRAATIYSDQTSLNAFNSYPYGQGW